MVTPDKYLTVEKAAALVGVHPQTIREWLRTGQLRGRKFGSIWRTTAEWLDEFGQQEIPQQPRPSPAECQRRSEAAMERIRRMFGG